MNASRKLTGQDVSALHAALIDAFPRREDLTHVVRSTFGENLDAITARDSLADDAYELIKWAEARERVADLVRGALAANADNLKLRALAGALGRTVEPVRLRHVPFERDAAFVGRAEELERVHRLFWKEEPEAVVMLVGMRGVGKTQLAVEYAYRYKDAYPGGIYWVDAAKDWVASLARIAERLKLPGGEGPEVDRPRRLARAFGDHLDAYRGQSDALLIFDNVEDSLALRDPSQDIVPTRLARNLLFTTWVRGPDLPFATVEVHPLREDALELLERSTGRRGLVGAEREAALRICLALGGLPLALVLAAAHLRNNRGVTFGGYLEGIRAKGAISLVDAAGVDARRLATNHEAAVGATLRTQWDALDDDDARLLLRAAAILEDATRAPKARLSLLTGLSDEGEPWNPPPLERAFQKLRDCSLVVAVEESDIHLHPLVQQLLVREIMTASDRAALARGCAGRLADALGAPERLYAEVARRGVDDVLGDIDAGIALAKSTMEGAEGADPSLRVLRRLLNQEAHHLRDWKAQDLPGVLLQQLRNACLDHGQGALRERAEAALERRGWEWLGARHPVPSASASPLRTLTGHRGAVNAVAVTPDGQGVLSAADDGSLRMWSLTGRCGLELRGHHDRVVTVAVAADGRLAVSGSSDGTVIAWDLHTGTILHTLTGHTDRVNALCLTRGGWAVSGSRDGTTRVWDLASGAFTRSIPTGPVDSNGLAVTADGRAVVASGTSGLCVWDLASGRKLNTLSEVFRGTSIALAPEGAELVMARFDGTLDVWDLRHGHPTTRLHGDPSSGKVVAVTGDGRLVVASSFLSGVEVWELSTSRRVARLEGHAGRVTGLAVSADGRLAASSSLDGAVLVWDLTHTTPSDDGARRARPVTSLGVTPDGRFAVTVSADKVLRVTDLDRGVCVDRREASVVGSNRTGLRHVVTRDGRYAVCHEVDTGSADRELVVRDPVSGALLATLKEPPSMIRHVAVTPDGRFTLFAHDRPALTVWDMERSACVGTLVGHKGAVSGVAISADGRVAASSSRDGTIGVWDIATGRRVHTLDVDRGDMRAVALTPDGRSVVAGAADGALVLWNLADVSAPLTVEGHRGAIVDLALSPNGRFIASASEDRVVLVVESATGRIAAALGVQAPATRCTFLPDGRGIVLGDALGGVRAYDWRRSV